MRRALAISALAAAALFAVAAAGFARSPGSRRAPSRLLVSGDEYSLMLSRGSVGRGPALIQFLNRGEDPHDLRLRRIGGASTSTVRAPEVKPGGLVELGTRLRPGRYRLWCSLPGHRARGMHALLVVKRR